MRSDRPYISGVLTYTLKTPEGKIRIVFKDEYEGRVYYDNIKEYMYGDIMNDPALEEIKRLAFK